MKRQTNSPPRDILCYDVSDLPHSYKMLAFVGAASNFTGDRAYEY